LARRLEFVCGHSVIGFDIFSQAVYYVERALYAGDVLDGGRSTLLALREMRAWEQLVTELEIPKDIQSRRHAMDVNSALELLMIAGTMAYSKCRDDCDRVYALLGTINRCLHQDGDDPVEMTFKPLQLPVSYKESAVTTYV
jgi:hypothetical protein